MCSNSFRGDKLDNAVGLIKEEMRRLDSVVMAAAEVARVPAGAALAVDREVFSREVTARLATEPRITVCREEITSVPPPSAPGDAVIIATGPLTSDALSQSIQAFVGEEHLSFYDAISPIVLAESIDMDKVFRQSRWGRSLRRDTARRARTDAAPVAVAAARAAEAPAAGPACGVDDGQGDYLNCPFTKAEYEAFYDALVTAESATDPRLRRGDILRRLPADRGDGPSRPRHAALRSDEAGGPRGSAHRPPALRRRAAPAGHARRRPLQPGGLPDPAQWGEQARVLRLVPGLEQAEFVRFGMVHRNTFINGPKVLLPTLADQSARRSVLRRSDLGVEGYVESAASGLIAGRNAARVAQGLAPLAPPRTTAIGALAYYASHADPRHYQPSNITFGIMPPLDTPPRDKALRKQALADRALADSAAWLR